MDENGEARGGPAFAGVGGASAIREHWDDLMDDMRAIAGEMRAGGREVLELHPGDVTAVTGERWGFDALVPDDEFDRLAAWVDAGTFDDHDVYRAESGLVFLLVVLRDSDRRRAICCPLYYDRAAADGLWTLAEREGRIHTHVRRLSEEYVTLTHEEPELFFPDAVAGDDANG